MFTTAHFAVSTSQSSIAACLKKPCPILPILISIYPIKCCSYLLRLLNTFLNKILFLYVSVTYLFSELTTMGKTKPLKYHHCSSSEIKVILILLGKFLSKRAVIWLTNFFANFMRHQQETVGLNTLNFIRTHLHEESPTSFTDTPIP